MANESSNDIIKSLKQELTDSMIPALTRIDMEMMKIHHKLETVLTKLDKHDVIIGRLITLSEEHDSRLEEFIIESRDTTTKIMEQMAQLKRDVPFMVPPFPPRPPPPGPRFGTPTSFGRFPPSYEPYCRASPELLPNRSNLYQKRNEPVDKAKKMANKLRAPVSAYGEGPIRNNFKRVIRSVVPQSSGRRSTSPTSSPPKPGELAQQWTRRGTGVFTSDEEESDEEEKPGASSSTDETPAAAGIGAYLHHEISSVAALMKAATIAKKAEEKNNATSATVAAHGKTTSGGERMVYGVFVEEEVFVRASAPSHSHASLPVPSSVSAMNAVNPTQPTTTQEDATAGINGERKATRRGSHRGRNGRGKKAARVQKNV